MNILWYMFYGYEPCLTTKWQCFICYIHQKMRYTFTINLIHFPGELVFYMRIEIIFLEMNYSYLIVLCGYFLTIIFIGIWQILRLNIFLLIHLNCVFQYRNWVVYLQVINILLKTNMALSMYCCISTSNVFCRRE